MECHLSQLIEQSAKQIRSLIYKDDFHQLKCYLDGLDRPTRKECVDHAILGFTALLKACELDRYNCIKYFVEECDADVNMASSKGFPPLYIACSHGDLYMCEFLINHGANIHWKDAEMRSYLIIFIENGSLCRFLISKGIDITDHDLYYKCAFLYALEKSALVSLEMLIKCGIDINEEPLAGEMPIAIACQNSNADLLDLLICNGGDINYVDDSKRTYLMSYITDYKICEILIRNGITINAKDNSGKTALHHAVLEYIPSTIPLLLEYIPSTIPLLLKNDADVLALDEDGMSPLHYAVRKRRLDLVLSLLSCGSDPNSKDSKGKTIMKSAIDKSVIQSETNNITFLKHILHFGGNVVPSGDLGWTELHYAVNERAGVKIYALLLKFGAEINFKTLKGKTPLHFAVSNNDIPSCNFLLTHGSDVNSADEDGKTPLHYAVKWGTSEMITLLCKYGANTNAVDNDGIGPIHEAAILKKNKLVENLLQHLNIYNTSKIDCYELMASDSFIHGTFEEGFEYLRIAITWREANGLISKPSTIVNSIFNNIREPETFQALMNLNDDVDTMLKQAVVIKSRIFGPCHSSVLKILRRYADEFEDESGKTLLKIKQHVLQCGIRDNGDQFKMTDEMEEIQRVFYELDPLAVTYFDIVPCIATVMHAYERVMDLSNEQMPGDILPTRLVVRSVALTLYQCFCLFTEIVCDKGIQTVRKYLRRFFEICPEEEIVNILFEELENGENRLCCKALHSFVEMAISRGFSTNLPNEDEGSTPLHMLLSCMEREGIKVDDEYVSLIDLFLKTGTHICKTNSTGCTVLELLSFRNYPVCKVRDRTLQCLAAESIVDANISFEGEVPVHLIPFIKEHGEFDKYMYTERFHCCR